ncbi:hypothetical protein [Aporhodopirellula aestuarii]|uniref:Uncharacterized protein n=1 Tax=Aporhodopirellula aestuarii TaxID=2950107 RepID=A0ABT0U5C4_9BACT|nr:hypothetical protein [Aporhodopirellula aestuarii]MCM2371633.1 hypothetical protein [Aporhodopirellula aestuarii]
MKKRTVYLLCAVSAVLVIAPVIAYATFRTHNQLDRFLVQRLALLETLDANAKELPPGFEHVLPPRASATHPGNDHIRSVIRSGQRWFGDTYSSYDLSLVGASRDAAPRDVLTELFQHLTRGMGELGFVSPKSGGPDWIVENRRAAHSTWWHNSNRNLIVTISMVVDAESNSVHVTRYVHEQFD